MTLDPSLLGQTVGQHALAVWLAGCVVFMAGGAGLLGAARRWRLPHERSALGGPGFVAAHLAVGALLWLLLGTGFALLAQRIGAGQGAALFDQALTETLRAQLPAPVLRGFVAPTWLGNPATVVVLTLAVTAGLLWRRHRLLALGWVAAVAGNALLNKGLKHLFERARPLHEHGVIVETGFSFPSGHASGTLATYGLLAYLVIRLAPRPWHLPAVLAAAWLSWTAACSRVALQVHYASDVLAGLCSGGAWLALCLLSLELARHRAPGRHRQT